jgi:hypothetical protein
MGPIVPVVPVGLGREIPVRDVQLLIVLDERSGVACRFSLESSGVGVEGGYPLFGLTHVVLMLEDTPGLTVALAHRKYNEDNPSTVEIFTDVIPNFTFSAESLANFDVVWMIGSGGPNEPIGATEVTAIAEFMQQGGGVFATGDHLDYGSAMAGLLTRVGEMRLWTGEATPQATGKTRITTIQPTSEACRRLWPNSSCSRRRRWTTMVTCCRHNRGVH